MLWVGAMAAVMLTSCSVVTGARGRSCSNDADCEENQLCREAQCRTVCLDGHYVGEPVKVKAGDESRSGHVAGCDARLWVRYESGIEEKVEPSRLAR